MVKRDLAAARLRRMGVDPEALDIDNLLRDEKEAKRIASLVASASSRGQAPLPPGKGPAPAPAKASAPAKVTKYRAVADFSGGEFSFKKGATIFVVGELKGNGMYQGVVNGKVGDVPEGKLKIITPELLQQEKEEQAKALEAALEEEKQKLEEEFKEKEAKALEEIKSSKPSTTPAEETTVKAANNEEFEKERQKLLEEEQRLKAEADKLFEMMRQLDMEDD
eukprot:m.52230 g.52230  ORF g.52230 m.52230 type:complete len:222 (-) comp18258_c0_seq1:240-905(-)